ncbi:MAG: toll/interleukin-1 receptor domain-containing protein [Candidatus Diapherotrites archaeon]|nr:toll/interleukin-1 receptor domain-containing protein [Candidatus Diapherotrites archaeon]
MLVCISYAKPEGLEYAKILEALLIGHGHDTFLFDSNYTLQNRVYSKIGSALDACRIAAIIITNSSHSSEEQKDEYNVACSLKKGVGIIQKGVPWGEFTMLTARQFFTFSESNARDKMKDFVKSISRIQETGKAKTIPEEGEMK